MAEQHIVPLSRQAVAVFKQLRDMNGAGSLVCPNQADHSKPMSENTIQFAIHDAGFKGRMCGHGFRHLASTTLNGAGWSPDVIERQLSHSDANQVRRAYNAAQYLPERRRMMQHGPTWSMRRATKRRSFRPALARRLDNGSLRA